MFANTVKLVGNADNVKETSIIDGPTNRKTLRGSTDGKLRLSVAHNESNENPGFVTQRSNIRVEEDFLLDDTDKSVKAYVQLTFSCPKEHVTSIQLADLCVRLINFVHSGENSGAAQMAGPTEVQAVVARIYAGEP